MSGVERLSQVLEDYGVNYWSATSMSLPEGILADPGPLLEALAEAGVLEAQVRDVCSCGSFRGGMWRPHNDTDDGVPCEPPVPMTVPYPKETDR